MQTANVMVAIAGDLGHTVPKFGVTAAEVAVLNAIHGAGAVHDIHVTGEVKRSSREELARLHDIYDKQLPNGTRGSEEIQALFPGAAARVFETFDEMGLDADSYRAVQRETPKPSADLIDATDDAKGGEAAAQKAKPKGKKAKAKKEAEAEESADEGDEADLEEDGIQDMDGKKGGIFG